MYKLNLTIKRTLPPISILFFIFFVLINNVYAEVNLKTNASSSVDKVSSKSTRIINPSKFFKTESPAVRKAYQTYEKTGQAPTLGNDEFVEFPYDESQPTIICKPLRECDIELETGELIRNAYVGDSEWWFYREAVSGEGDELKMHFVVRPRRLNLASNVVITTTKRTYHLKIVSDPNRYLAQVKFYYPQEMEKEWQQFNTQLIASQFKQKETEIATSPQIDLNKIDDNYRIRADSGGWFGPKPSWKPLRVFNAGGQQVFIEMPANMRRNDAPVLFVLNRDGKKALVNYRIRNNWYIVDDFFEKAVMVAGVGLHQERVIITYKG